MDFGRDRMKTNLRSMAVARMSHGFAFRQQLICSEDAIYNEKNISIYDTSVLENTSEESKGDALQYHRSKLEPMIEPRP